MRSQRPEIDMTGELTKVMNDICSKTPEFSHINTNQVVLALSNTRNKSLYGTFAKIVPLRFPDGSDSKIHKGNIYRFQQLPVPGGYALYVIYFYFPRFFLHPFEKRLLTLIHELYHISPKFDGTVRRIGSRAHGASRNKFNDNLQPIIDNYMRKLPDDDMLRIMRTDLPTLQQQGNLFAARISMPKAILVKPTVNSTR